MILAVFSSCSICFVTSLAFVRLYPFCCFFPTLWPTEILDSCCGDPAQMVQILGSAHGSREGWDEGVSLFAEPLHGSFSLLHLDICSSPSPSPQSWGEQVGKLSLLHVFCPCISCLFAYASTTRSSFPSSRKRTCLVLMRAATSREGKGISARFTSR